MKQSSSVSLTKQKKSTSSTSSCTKQKQKKWKLKHQQKSTPGWNECLKKTKVILTKIWFFFLIFFFASWTPLHLAAAVIDIVFSLTFFFQKSMLKKDNYSVCLNVAIFKNKQKKIPTNLISFIFWFIANPQWNRILWNLVLWLDIKKVDDTTNHLIWI